MDKKLSIKYAVEKTPDGGVLFQSTRPWGLFLAITNRDVARDTLSGLIGQFLHKNGIVGAREGCQADMSGWDESIATGEGEIPIKVVPKAMAPTPITSKDHDIHVTWIDGEVAPTGGAPCVCYEVLADFAGRGVPIYNADWLTDTLKSTSRKKQLN